MYQSSQKTVSLRDYIRINRVNLTAAIGIFIDLVKAVNIIHAGNIVHNDINPDTIQLDLKTNSVVLFSSELSINVSEGAPAVIAMQPQKEAIQGQLPYISPEQTGRTAHPIDFRSDYYSLGIILYELLTKSLPFDCHDPFQMIHAHIAVTPPPADKRNERVPEALANIASKLLSKNATDRYQTATGLIADLEICLKMQKRDGEIKLFPIGTYDVSPVFEMPRMLYGRYREIQRVLDMYASVKNGGVGIVFFSGPPGIGKSYLVNEVCPYLVSGNGYFIKGKFDQFAETMPCSAIVQAFSDLTRRIMTLSEEAVQKKRKAILNAVGRNGQLIIDVIPELGKIIGDQPEPENVAPLEARNRFIHVFQRFVRSVADLADPIVLFLDDLHWADGTSLQLMESVLCDIELEHVLFIGCYRDIEGERNSYLDPFLKRLQQNRNDVNQVGLKPMDDEYIAMLIEETVSVDSDESNDLVDLIARRTHRNPLFIREFIVDMYEEGVINCVHSECDSGKNPWHIDMEAALNTGFSDGIVELLQKRIRKLGHAALTSLGVAACIGTQFSEELIAAVLKQTVADIRICLKQALDQGLLVRVNDGFKFTHDCAREAAYALNDPEKRTEIHYAIGKMMLSDWRRHKQSDIFRIVTQLNLACKLISGEEKQELIRLNIAAGQRAKRLTAYPAARDYFNTGIMLLGETAWYHQYALALEIHSEAAEIAYLCREFRYAFKLVQTVIENARGEGDKVSAYEIKLRCLMMRNQFKEAVNEALMFLKLFNCNLPEEISRFHISWELFALRWALWRKSFGYLRNMPENKDAKISVRNRILKIVASAIYATRPKLTGFMVLRGLRESLARGSVTPETATLFAIYGSFLKENGQIEKGYHFGQLALSLTDRAYTKPHLKAAVSLHVYTMMLYWKHPIRDALQPLLDTYHLFLASGERQMAAQAISCYCSYAFISGMPLSELLSKITCFYRVVHQQSPELAHTYLLVTYQLILGLTGTSQPQLDEQEAIFNTGKARKQYLSASEKMAITGYHFSKVIINYFAGDYVNALKHSELVFHYMQSQHDSSLLKSHLFYYDSLVRLELLQGYTSAGEGEPSVIRQKTDAVVSNATHLDTIAANQKELKKWAKHAPMNFRSKWVLIEALRAFVGGRKEQAEKGFHQAIELAREHLFLHEEALANTFLARFYVSFRDKKQAGKYYNNAIALLKKWGAKEKTLQLLKEYRTAMNPEIQHEVTIGAKDTWLSPDTKIALSKVEMDLKLFSETLGLRTGKHKACKYLYRFSQNVIRYTGSRRFLLLLNTSGTLSVGIDNHIEKKTITFTPVEADMFPDTVVRYVLRARETVLLDNAADAGMFVSDPYIKAHRVKSVICVPLIYQGRLTSVLYLENNLNCAVFTWQHQKLLEGLCNQIALFFDSVCLTELDTPGFYSPLTSAMFMKTLRESYGLTYHETHISALLKEGYTRTQICEILSIPATELRRNLRTIYNKTIHTEDDNNYEDRVDNLSRLILFLFRQIE